MHAFDVLQPPLAFDEHGVIRVAGTGVSLESVVIAFDRGATAEEIVDRFPTLDLASVFSALAYVLLHRERVDEYLAQRGDVLDELRTEAEQRFPAAGLRARLASRRERSSQ